MRKLEEVFEKKYYPDGSFYAKQIEEIYEGSLELEVRINSYEDLWFLAQCKSVLDYIGTIVFIHIPCFLDQQADRRFADIESFNLKLVCEFINSLDFTGVSIYHPHSDVLPALLDNCNVIDNSTFISNVLTEIPDEVILLSTDAGGFKSMMKLVDSIGWEGEVSCANKSRKYVESKSILIQGVDREDFEGKSLLLVDDMCLYGGTFLGLAKLLKERNCGKLYLAVSHLTVKNPNKELETYFEQVFCSNSKYSKEEYDLNNLTILPYN